MTLLEESTCGNQNSQTMSGKRLKSPRKSRHQSRRNTTRNELPELKLKNDAKVSKIQSYINYPNNKVRNDINKMI